MYIDFLTLWVLRPERLALADRVVGNNSVGGVEDILCAAVVLLKSDNPRSAEGLFKGKNVLDRSAAELVDTLVVVADYADIAVLLS